MIEKLKSKIFLLMMTSLSIIVIGIIILFAVFNCTNTVRVSRMSIDRVTRMREGPHGQNLQIRPQIQSFIKEENERVNNHLRNTTIISIFASGISVIAIYIVSKKVSEIIVKPVSDTFEKQKQFISDASHELKTPLAVIEANADVLENEMGNNKWLTYIQNETESMDKLINELLLLAKIEQDKIFERFYRVDKSRNRTEKRYGLGLSIAKSIVEKYNGKIEVECKDGITSFIVMLST